MGNVSVIYSHAAPFIRQALIYKAHEVVSATTIRDRTAAREGVYAFSTCLRIMKDAGDQTPADGLPDVDAYPIDGLRYVVEYYKASLEEEFGTQAAAEIHDRLARYEEIQTRSARAREEKNDA